MCTIDVFLPLNNTTISHVAQTSVIGALFYGARYLFAYANETGPYEEGVLMTVEQLRAGCEQAVFI